MKRAIMLTRLVALRHAQQRAAYQNVLRRAANVRAAERRLEAASASLVRQIEQGRARERAEIQSLIGRSIPVASMIGFPADLNLIAAETLRLRNLERDAEMALQDNQLALEAARGEFRARERAASKLDGVAAEQARKMERYQELINESAQEEQASISAETRP